MVAFLYPAIAFTKPLSCEVLDSKSLGNGTLQSTDFSNLYIGNKFILDKKTGKMLGDLQNHNSNGEPTVLDYGSDKQNYKAITVYKPYTQVELIQVTYDKNKKISTHFC